MSFLQVGCLKPPTKSNASEPKSQNYKHDYATPTKNATTGNGHHVATNDNFDQMLDAIIKHRNDSKRWEQTAHLLAQALLDLSRHDTFQPTEQFTDAVLAYNRTVRMKYRNRPNDLPVTDQ